MQLGTKLGYFTLYVSHTEDVLRCSFFKRGPSSSYSGLLCVFWRTLVLGTQSALAVAHRVEAHRIRYVFLFSEETSELYLLLLELNDFSAFRPILFLCFTNVRLLAR